MLLHFLRSTSTSCFSEHRFTTRSTVAAKSWCAYQRTTTSRGLQPPPQVKTKRKKKVPTGILCRPAKTPKENNWGKSSYTTSDIWQSRKSKGTQLHFHIFVCACRALAFTVVCAIPFTSCSSGDESTEIEDRWVVFRGCVGGGARKSKLCMASLWWRN